MPQQCGADPADLESLRRFARARGLTETGADAARRVLHLRATPQALASAFAVSFGQYQLADGRGPFIGCEPAPALPPEAIAVLGLDRRPVARPHFRRPRTTPARAYTPLEVGALYEFPPGTDGSGQGVAIIELGGGFRASDLVHYFRALGLATAPAVTAVAVAGGANAPGGDADAEVLLDIEVIGALAPAAALAVYFAPNTDQGFYEAISQAAHDAQRRITVMSISWGGPEDGWSSSARTAMQSALEDAVALGVSVTVACGDSGSSDGVSGSAPHVDFPASSPAALACGGTRLDGQRHRDRKRGRVERPRDGGGGDGRRGERAVPAARLAGGQRRAEGPGRASRARRTRRGRQCRSADRLPGLHRRAARR